MWIANPKFLTVKGTQLQEQKMKREQVLVLFLLKNFFTYKDMNYITFLRNGVLKDIRNKMYPTEAGDEVMHAVNDFYYSFSPTVADWERENPVFRESVKLLITPSMASFMILDHNSIDSEIGLIGYVISAVMLNVGMDVAAPAIVIWQIRKRI